jgi:uncharacterized Tic20 family protein
MGAWAHVDMSARFGQNGTRLVDPHASSGERTYATFVHLGSAIVCAMSGFGLAILPALVMWLIKKNESPFLDDHGKEAVNFHISLLIYAIVSGVLAMCGIGFVMLIGLWILGTVAGIMAAVAANRGEFYRYPMCIRMIA